MFVHKLMTFVSVLLLALNLQAAQLDDKDALKGVEKGQVLFDINTAYTPKALALYLTVIGETYDGLVRQNVKPDIVLAFRGQAVRLINTQRDDGMALEFKASLDEVASLIKGLQHKGVKMEACGVAMRLFNIPAL